MHFFFFFSSRRRHTRSLCDWSSDVCSSDLPPMSSSLKCSSLKIGAPLQIGDITIPGRVLTAPMTGVSDLPFRRIASRCGAAYVATEMVACDSFARGRPDVVRRAAIGEGLPLMVIQLVGRTPEWIAKGAKLAEQAGADIIDFNMGCPAKEVTGALRSEEHTS